VFSALFAALTAVAPAGETLPNGIVLPDVWPPRTGHWNGEPMPVPYLDAPPHVVTIEMGRQLFVDDFLIQSTNMTRIFHRPDYHPSSPVLKPETEWEHDDEDGGIAAPYSDGVWYDPQSKRFRMWYRAAERRTCLAESVDGIVLDAAATRSRTGHQHRAYLAEPDQSARLERRLARLGRSRPLLAL
jgi:hypothetical protein